MQISNINTLSFNANRRNFKRNAQVSEQPFDSNKRVNNTKRNIVAIAGAAAVGITAGALLVHKKPDLFKKLTDKIQSINPFKKNPTLQADNLKIKHTPEVDITAAKDVKPKVSLKKVSAPETAAAEMQKEKVSLTKPAAQEAAAVVKEQQHRVSLEKTSASEKTNIQTPNAEKVQEINDAVQPAAPVQDADTAAQTVQNVAQESQEVQKEQKNLTDITKKKARRAERHNDDIPDMRKQARNQGKIKHDSTLNSESVKKTSSASQTDNAPVQQDNKPLAKNIVPEAKISANIQDNSGYLNKRINDNSVIYSDFGIDKEIEAEFLKLNPALVNEMNDDVFLSYLLAPQDKISINFRELASNTPKGGSIRAKLNSTLLKNTKAAKEEKATERKFDLYHIVSDIASKDARIEKLHALEENFTPEEIHKIFNSQDEFAKHQLLYWLMSFYTQGQKSAKSIEYIKSMLA